MAKILLVANTDWYLYNFRLALARFLRARNYEVVMISPRGKFVPAIERAGFRWIEWQVGRRTLLPAGEIKAVHRLAKIYHDEKPDLVHHFTIKPVLYGSLAARYARIPAVVNSVTGLGYVFLTESWLGKILRRILMPVYRLAFTHPNIQVIFENGNDRAIFVKNRLVKPTESCIISGVGVDTDWYQPAPEPETQAPLIVFPARMLLDKGLGTLVEAARILRQKVEARVALVGEPDPGNPATVTEADLKSWENEGLVEWWGFQKNMRGVYQKAQIVTLPSLGEGLPTVLIEAAACARPIVTTDVAGCREVVTHGVNGLLVPPSNPQALADALQTLIQDAGLRSRMGAAGRKIVLDRFTNERVNQETFSIYERLFARGEQTT